MESARRRNSLSSTRPKLQLDTTIVQSSTNGSPSLNALAEHYFPGKSRRPSVSSQFSIENNVTQTFPFSHQLEASTSNDLVGGTILRDFSTLYRKTLSHISEGTQRGDHEEPSGCSQSLKDGNKDNIPDCPSQTHTLCPPGQTSVPPTKPQLALQKRPTYSSVLSEGVTQKTNPVGVKDTKAASESGGKQEKQVGNAGGSSASAPKKLSYAEMAAMGSSNKPKHQGPSRSQISTVLRAPLDSTLPNQTAFNISGMDKQPVIRDWADHVNEGCKDAEELQLKRVSKDLPASSRSTTGKGEPRIAQSDFETVKIFGSPVTNDNRASNSRAERIGNINGKSPNSYNNNLLTHAPKGFVEANMATPTSGDATTSELHQGAHHEGSFSSKKQTTKIRVPYNTKPKLVQNPAIDSLFSIHMAAMEDSFDWQDRPLLRYLEMVNYDRTIFITKYLITLLEVWEETRRGEIYYNPTLENMQSSGGDKVHLDQKGRFDNAKFNDMQRLELAGFFQKLEHYMDAFGIGVKFVEEESNDEMSYIENAGGFLRGKVKQYFHSDEDQYVGHHRYRKSSDAH